MRGEAVELHSASPGLAAGALARTWLCSHVGTNQRKRTMSNTELKEVLALMDERNALKSALEALQRAGILSERKDSAVEGREQRKARKQARETLEKITANETR